MLNEKQREFLNNALFAVLTVSEAALAFGRNRSTILYHIDRDNVVWRTTDDGRYLVSRESLIALYGMPHGKQFARKKTS